jgi:PIN domain nuclease of toxin-antitoxin system
MIVLDSSALMAFLLREPGHDVVATSVAEAIVSTVSLSEVLARMSRERIASRQLLPRLTETGMSIVDFDQDHALIASELRESARKLGMGLADCCCLALAIVRRAPVLTADRAWLQLGLKLDIRLIR